MGNNKKQRETIENNAQTTENNAITRQEGFLGGVKVVCQAKDGARGLF